VWFCICVLTSLKALKEHASILLKTGQMSDKVAQGIRFQCPRPLRHRLRSRHILLTILILCVYFYLSADTDRIPFYKTQSPYTIQAKFPSESAAAKTLRLQRRGQVKDAFKHAWKGYKDHAWLHDEVMPVSGGQKDPFVGWAATLVDSLDSLYILGMKDEFEEAVAALEQIDFSKPNADKVPVFEVTIRYLGGLLGAWDISEHKYPILLQKARQLGEFLSRVFDTNNGLPVSYYWWNNNTSGKLPNDEKVIIAQIASLSLEFIRLSQVTGDSKYAAQIQTVTDQLELTQTLTDIPGMWPIVGNCSGTHLSFEDKTFSLGVLAGEISSLLG
jgi:mannosyl-oligosaccharide alpha-1,2-mannosidase